MDILRIVPNDTPGKRTSALVILMILVTVGSIFAGFSTHSEVLRALLFGISIFAAAFILSWGAELAELEIPKSMAVAILALITVLPEYAVDGYFAWTAGKDPSYIAYATANMTGGNRLIIGVGWALVVFLFWLKTRKGKLEFERGSRVEVGYLLVASLYSFIIPLKGTISIFDTVIFVALFVGYMLRISKTHKEEPHLVGPPKLISMFSKNKRRILTVFFFVFAAAAIFSVVEPFAEALLNTGRLNGLDEFFLVQWLAPLASEAPEFIVACIFVLKLLPKTGFGALLSSKINQWTLLIGTLPVIYAISLGVLHPMVLDNRQVQELLLTAAQSLFAVSILLNLRITFKGAITLFALFIFQFLHPELHYPLSFVYLLMAAFFFARDRSHIMPAIKSLWK